MRIDSYKRLAERLDALPNGFPPAPDGAELRLLAKLYTPEEADLAAELRLNLETPEQIAARLSETRATEFDPTILHKQLKSMSRKGLIAVGRTQAGLGFGLMPFVVGIYEAQAGRVDAELARLFEDYYRQAFKQMLEVQPAFHRVVPIGETIRADMEIQPFESASEIVNNAQAWGVLDCICRLQKALIGEPCGHPLDVCMILSRRPGAFDQNSTIRALSREEALSTLRRAAQAGLVHSVSNSRQDVSYICNCCTCSCGILRGMADMGIANVIARSAFVNQVDESLCIGCEACMDYCQFQALSLQDGVAFVQTVRCVGCGVCVPACPENALSLIRRPAEDILPIPATEDDWRAQRAAARGQDLRLIL
ncbi:MAG: 4Fe-4S binding protein [Anaerolineales bacterium]|nr:4Fe-4S binding protein [Anaerolineales bacterium]